MKRVLTRVFITAVLFGVMAIFSAWAGNTQVTILYSNNINGQIYPAG